MQKQYPDSYLREQRAKVCACTRPWLTGWVKNEYDGTVVMEVQGREAMIFELMKGLNRNQFIQIDWIDTEEKETETESSFEVKY